MSRTNYTRLENYGVFGPFIYMKGDTASFSVLIDSGEYFEEKNTPRCYFRISLFFYTLVLELPQIVRPWRVYRYDEKGNRIPAKLNRGTRVYGFTIQDGKSNLYFGKCLSLARKDTSYV